MFKKIVDGKEVLISTKSKRVPGQGFRTLKDPPKSRKKDSAYDMSEEQIKKTQGYQTREPLDLGKAKTGAREPGVSIIEKTLWERMFIQYKKIPTAAHLVRTCGVDNLRAVQAINKGFPEQNLVAFTKLLESDESATTEMNHFKKAWNDIESIKGETTRLRAEETLASRVSMSAAVQAARMSQAMAGRVLTLIEEGAIDTPEKVSPHLIHQVIKSLDLSTTIMERAMKITRLKSGEGDSILAVDIGILLERCKDDELDYVARTGQLPGRIITQRKKLNAVMEGDRDEELQENEINKIDYDALAEEITLSDEEVLDIVAPGSSSIRKGVSSDIIEAEHEIIEDGGIEDNKNEE